jgi:hypothetical protein
MTAARPHCDTTTNTCVQCAGASGDSECAAPTPYCVGDKCVQCTTTTNCGGTDVCNAENRCVVSCTPDGGQCAAPEAVCNPATTTCVQCLTSTDCMGAVRPACNTTTNTCVECTTSTQCAGNGGGEVVCNPATDTCVQCTESSQCMNTARPVCNPEVHECVPR